MTFAAYANKGNVDVSQFKRVKHGYWTYWSVFNGRLYDLELVQKEDNKFYWSCNCPDARHTAHKEGRQCKHEQALARMLKSCYEQKCMAEIEAEQIITDAQERNEQSTLASLQAELVGLRAEIASLHDELAEARAAIQTPISQALDLTAIFQKLTVLETENTEIKRALATKATARKKHQSEQEAADIKRDMNLLAGDVIETANNTIQTVSMLQKRIADLESIPHELKQELDSWTEAGKVELQPDYKPDDYNALEIKAQIRAAQEQARERREATAEERREMAPLNGNGSFNFYR